MEDSQQRTRRLAAARRVALRTKADCGEALYDPDQPRSALDNLVLNAIQAAPVGTTVTFAARRIGDELRLSVHDEGPGPPPEIVDRLFEPFVTGRTNGVGLGLPVVQEVAKAHGGYAHFARSITDTTFEIVLPWPRP